MIDRKHYKWILIAVVVVSTIVALVALLPKSDTKEETNSAPQGYSLREHNIRMVEHLPLRLRKICSITNKTPAPWMESVGRYGLADKAYDYSGERKMVRPLLRDSNCSVSTAILALSLRVDHICEHSTCQKKLCNGVQTFLQNGTLYGQPLEQNGAFEYTYETTDYWCNEANHQCHSTIPGFPRMYQFIFNRPQEKSDIPTSAVGGVWANVSEVGYDRVEQPMIRLKVGGTSHFQANEEL